MLPFDLQSKFSGLRDGNLADLAGYSGLSCLALNGSSPNVYAPKRLNPAIAAAIAGYLKPGSTSYQVIAWKLDSSLEPATL